MKILPPPPKVMPQGVLPEVKENSSPPLMPLGKKRVSAWDLVDPASGSILSKKIKAKSARIHITGAAKIFDLNDDGDINAQELEAAGARMEAKLKTISSQKKVIVLAMIIILCSVLANFGLTWYAVQKAKTVESAELGGDGHHYLTDTEGEPLRVDRSRDTAELSSSLSDELFDKMDQLQITGEKGSITMTRMAWARYNEPRSRHGTVVVIYSQIGSVEFDGTTMHFTEQVAGAFDRAGFVTSDSRRRREAGNAHSRRIRGVVSVMGTFSFITGLEQSDADRRSGESTHTLDNKLDQKHIFLQEVHYISCDIEGCRGKVDRSDIEYLPVKDQEGTEIADGANQTGYLKRIKNIYIRKDESDGNKPYWYSETYVEEYGNKAVFVEVGSPTTRSSYTAKVETGSSRSHLKTAKFYCDEGWDAANAANPLPVQDVPLEDDEDFNSNSPDAVVSYVGEMYHADGTRLDAYVAHSPSREDPTGVNGGVPAFATGEGFLFYEVADRRAARLYAIEFMSDFYTTYPAMYGSNNNVDFGAEELLEAAAGDEEELGKMEKRNKFDGFRERAADYFDDEVAGRWEWAGRGPRGGGQYLGPSEYFFDIEGDQRGTEACYKASTHWLQLRTFYSDLSRPARVWYIASQYTLADDNMDGENICKHLYPKQTVLCDHVIEDVMPCLFRLQNEVRNGRDVSGSRQYPACEIYGDRSALTVLRDPAMRAVDAPPDLMSYVGATPFDRRKWAFQDPGRKRRENAVALGKKRESRDASANACSTIAFEFPPDADDDAGKIEFEYSRCKTLKNCESGVPWDWALYNTDAYSAKAIGPPNSLFGICSPVASGSATITSSMCTADPFSLTGELSVGLACGWDKKVNMPWPFEPITATIECTGLIGVNFQGPPAKMGFGVSGTCEGGVEIGDDASVIAEVGLSGSIGDMSLSCDSRTKPTGNVKLSGKLKLKIGSISKHVDMSVDLFGPKKFDAPHTSDGKMPEINDCPPAEAPRTCATGSHWLHTTQNECIECDVCDSGDAYISEACGQTSQSVCAASTVCEEGVSFEPGGATRAIDEDRVCEACTDCHAQKKLQESACTLTQDAVCVACSQGTFYSSGLRACVDRTPCAAEQYDANWGSTTGDSKCRACFAKVYSIALPNTNLGNSNCNNKFTQLSNGRWEFNNKCPFSETVIEDCSEANNRRCGNPNGYVHDGCSVDMSLSWCNNLGSHADMQDCLTKGMGGMGRA